MMLLPTGDWMAARSGCRFERETLPIQIIERPDLLRSANPNPVGAAKIETKNRPKKSVFFVILCLFSPLKLPYPLVTLRGLDKKLFFIGTAIRLTCYLTNRNPKYTGPNFFELGHTMPSCTTCILRHTIV